MMPIYTYVRGDLKLGAPVHAGLQGEDGWYFTMHTNALSILAFCNKHNERRIGQARPTIHPIQVYADGNMWCAIPTNFINLQESPAGFGDTMIEAIEKLCEAMHQEAMK